MPELADHMDPSLSAEQRCELLLERMTLEEKVGQMCQYVGEVASDRASNVDEVAGYSLLLGEKVELIRSGRVGSFLKVPGALEANYLQQQAEATRLKIPLLIGTDAIHGHGMDLGASTIFASPSAWRRRSMSGSPSASPRPPRARCGRRGFTGRSRPTSTSCAIRAGAARARRSGKTRISPASSARRWWWAIRGRISPVSRRAGVHQAPGRGGVPDNVFNGSAAELSERTLREFFLPPFERTVQAGVYTLMPSHNEVNGVPCHADDRSAHPRAARRLGFQGFVISDWLDIERLHSVHHVAETRRDADRQAVLAGVDMHMHGGQFFENVVAAVREGDIPATRIDEAVSKILFAKFQLGLFERRYADEAEIQKTVLSPAHVELALESPQEPGAAEERRRTSCRSAASNSCSSPGPTPTTRASSVTGRVSSPTATSAPSSPACGARPEPACGSTTSRRGRSPTSATSRSPAPWRRPRRRRGGARDRRKLAARQPGAHQRRKRRPRLARAAGQAARADAGAGGHGQTPRGRAGERRADRLRMRWWSTRAPCSKRGSRACAAAARLPRCCSGVTTRRASCR